MSRSTVIRVRHMRFWGRHGVSEAERAQPQELELDLEMRLAPGGVHDSDRIEDTVDYDTAYRRCESVVTRRSFALLESLADACLAEVLADRRVEQATVRVRKPGLLEGATPEVEVTRTRAG
jgi:dihydroneopterin aldolase